MKQKDKSSDESTEAALPNLNKVYKDEPFCYWFTGLCDGEASFCSGKNEYRKTYLPRFKLCLEGDDELLLDIESRFRIGYFRVGWKPLSFSGQGVPYSHRGDWDIKDVGGMAHCALLVEFFQRYPLRSHRKRDFGIWTKFLARSQELIRTRKLLSSHGASELLSFSLELSKGKTSGQSQNAQRTMKEWLAYHQSQIDAMLF